MAKTRRKKKAETATETPDLSFAAWVRTKVLTNPELTVDELKALAEKEGRSEKINDKQVIYQAKNTIRKRWGVDPSELPRAKDGSVNMAGMVRLYLDKFGTDSTEKKAKAYFATDGIELKAGAFGNAKTAYVRKQGNLDPNAGKGPRARHTTKKGRKPGRKPGRRKQQQQVRGRNKSQDVTVELLMQTKQYIENVGGVDQARTLMNFIEEIQALPKG